MQKVKIAVIGAGWWGTRAHIPALKDYEHADLVAVQARTMEKARQIADDFGVPMACTTVDEVLAIDGLQAVVVSSTPNVHYEQTKAALERGMHVMLEKPMTINVAQAKELVELADRKGLHFVIGCPWHYSPHVVEARRLVESGALGQLRLISMMHNNFVAGLYQGLPLDQAFRIKSKEHLPYRMPSTTSYSDPAVAGGGQIYTQVSHVAAFLGYLTRSDPVEVFARFDNAGAPVDVYDSITTKLADGTLVSITSHGLPMPRDTHFEVRAFGTRGAITMDLVRGTMEFRDMDGNHTAYPDLGPERYQVYGPARNLVDAILGLAPNGSPAWLGVYAMKIIEASCQSASSGKNITMSA
jgi:predicted dehydrogenase